MQRPVLLPLVLLGCVLGAACEPAPQVVEDPEPSANRAPVAQDDVAATSVDTPVGIDVLANDSDPDGDALQLAALGAPAHGAAAIDGRAVGYTPAAGYAGVDSFTYTVSDGRGGQASATVTIGVSAPGNQAPVAVDDSAATSQGQAITVDVLANDSDPDGDPLSVESTTQPSGGTASTDGAAVRFEPAAGSVGQARFSYTISDGRGGLASAWVTVEVVVGNSAPTAQDPGRVVTAQEQAVAIALTGSDVQDAEAELTVAIVSLPAHGALDATAGPAPLTVLYTPEPGWTGLDALSFSVTDRGGLSSAPQVVQISVDALSSWPVPTALATVVTAEDTPSAAFALTGVDAEDSEGELTIEVVTPPSHGSLSAASGPAPLSEQYTPDPDYAGTDGFEFVVVDTGLHRSAPQWVSLRVTAVNDAPVITGQAEVRLDEDGTRAIAFADLVVSDPDDSYPTGFTLSVLDGAGYTHVANVISPPVDYHGPLSVAVKVNDGPLDSNTFALAVTVTPVNDAPIAHASSATTTWDQPVAGRVAAVDGDGDALSFSVASQPAHGSVTLDASSGDYSYQPAAGSAGFDSWSFQAHDPEAASNVAPVHVYVARPAGLAHHLAFAVEPAPWAFDDRSWDSFSVQVLDERGALVTSASDAITLSLATGSGALQGTTTRSAVGGVATFDDIVYPLAEAIALELSADNLLGLSAVPVLIVGHQTVTAVATGGSHSCAVTGAGAVRCWGRNDSGQLGINSWTDQLTPVEVQGLSSGVVAVAAGASHSCALTSGGGVKCWGQNYQGQLGDSTTTERKVPVNVAGLSSGVVAIRAGSAHTCALTSGGGLKCWGSNASLQLGVPTLNPSRAETPQTLASSGVAGVATGGSHTCALSTGGAVQCWGSNLYGQLGNASSTGGVRAVDVTGLGSGVSGIVAGSDHSCAWLADGSARCWGRNASGQLGDGTTTGRGTPVTVSGLADVVAMTAGSGHSCALSSSAGVLCWGQGGRVGDGSVALRTAPVAVPGLSSGVLAIASRAEHSCAVTDAGQVLCWGSALAGQIGDLVTAARAAPVEVPGLPAGLSALACGGASTCALTRSGEAWCWGANSSGQLGDGTTVDRLEPAPVADLAPAAALSTGSNHGCALSGSGGVACWGLNNYGQLGDGTTSNSPLPVGVLGLEAGLASLAAGLNHACALTPSGGVLCWGRNNSGQLGWGGFTDGSTADYASGRTQGWMQVVGGDFHTCALSRAGAVACWGSNMVDQLGDSSLSADAVALDAGIAHNCAVLRDGALRCWGYNYSGQLGDGTTGYGTDKAAPIEPLGLGSGVVAVATGSDHTCALTDAGQVQCWGKNVDGQLGDRSLVNREVPAGVSGLAAGAVQVAAGASHSCALTAGDRVLCWGDGSRGQLGRVTAVRTAPAAVVGLGP